jgi:hypothetical protein
MCVGRETASAYPELDSRADPRNPQLKCRLSGMEFVLQDNALQTKNAVNAGARPVAARRLRVHD